MHTHTHRMRTYCVFAWTYLQGDNASDNKNWALVAFFGMLIYHGYTQEVYFSFLLVGHTHEDIDQLFSVISRYMKSLLDVMTPQQFQREMANAIDKRPHVIEEMKAVLDWDSFLRPSLVSPLPVGLQHATLPVSQDTPLEVSSCSTFPAHTLTY